MPQIELAKQALKAKQTSLVDNQPKFRAYRISDSRRVLGIGKSKIYEMAAAGELKLVRIGGRTLIPADEVERLLGEAAHRTE